MILKRPRGKNAETPDQLRQRLLKGWDAQVRDHLAGDVTSDPEAWPLEVNIGSPGLTGDALVKNVIGIRVWIDSWSVIETQEDIRFADKIRRGVGQIRIPEQIIFPDIDRLAAFLGRGAQDDLARARARLDDLTVIDPRLSGMAPSWRKIIEMSDDEHNGACDFLAQRQYSEGDHLSIREMLVESVGGKFLEQRRSIMEGALSHMGLLREGEDYRARLGFRTDDRQTLWVKTHPNDMTGPFGANQFAVRPSEIQAMPDTIRQVTIVENVETFFGYTPEPGVCLFFGSGNAIAGMARNIPDLEERHVVYWGDLDSFGMKILSRLRRAVPHAASAMMDFETMTGVARDAWRHEPESDRYRGEITSLTPEEQSALELIRSGNHRIEQEHLRPGAHELKKLGLRRAEYFSA